VVFNLLKKVLEKGFFAQLREMGGALAGAGRSRSEPQKKFFFVIKYLEKNIH
jgi:hypothetical protein